MPAVKEKHSVRWLIRRDMPEILGFDKFAHLQEDLWGEEEWAGNLRERNCIGMVVTNRIGAVVGAMLYELHKDHLVLLRFVVHPAHRREAYGSSLMDRLLSKLSQGRRRRIEFLVAEEYLGMQLFLQAHGFLATFERNAFGGGRDGYLFEYFL